MELRPKTRTTRIFLLLVIAVAFGLAYTQNPLYSANQNTYFLHGLRANGVGLLNEDWMANTVDPFPLFSSLVYYTLVAFSPAAFYVYQSALLGIYILAILGIACRTFEVEWWSSRFFVCAFALIGLHSLALAETSLALTGKNLVYMVDVGVAQQSVISHELLPSTFGVLLILSVYVFLRGRPYLAVVLCALAASFHSSYALSAIILILAYAGVIFMREPRKGTAGLLALVGFVLLLPLLISIFFSFWPSSPRALGQAAGILAHFRIPQHAEPGRWFNKQAIGMLVVVLLGTFLARKKVIFPLLASALLVGLVLTAVQIVTSSDMLALIFPWRVSAWLVPICWGLIIAAVTNAVAARTRWAKNLPSKRAVLNITALVGIMLLGAYGGWRMYGRVAADPSGKEGEGMMRFVSLSAKPGQLYLVPVEMERFRLFAGVPILVDWKTHPYKDAEVIEWYQRLSAARRFYSAEGDSALGALRDIQKCYGVTHVVMPRERKMSSISGLPEVYRDSTYAIFRADL